MKRSCLNGAIRCAICNLSSVTVLNTCRSYQVSGIQARPTVGFFSRDARSRMGIAESRLMNVRKGCGVYLLTHVKPRIDTDMV